MTKTIKPKCAVVNCDCHKRGERQLHRIGGLWLCRTRARAARFKRTLGWSAGENPERHQDVIDAVARKIMEVAT